MLSWLCTAIILLEVPKQKTCMSSNTKLVTSCMDFCCFPTNMYVPPVPVSSINVLCRMECVVHLYIHVHVQCTCSFIQSCIYKWQQSLCAPCVGSETRYGIRSETISLLAASSKKVTIYIFNLLSVYILYVRCWHLPPSREKITRLCLSSSITFFRVRVCS